MLVENRELLSELEDSYPTFFDNELTHIIFGRGSNKTLSLLIFNVQYYYSLCFKYKLQYSDKSLTRKEYEDGLRNIENIIINGRLINNE